MARKFGLSEFVIGLTIVGMGTSAPEMVVSFIGAFEGNADISVGNVIGSNIFNTITEENRKKDIPLNIVITVLLVLMGLKHSLFGIGTDGISRLEGGILLTIFVAYMVMSFRKKKTSEESETAQQKVYPVWLAVLMILGGLAALIFGGRFFVNSATNIAHGLGVSDKFIAITILAGGTSMPELATCVAAAVKKKGQLALGNIIGSNLFNILLILGGSALIQPLSFDHIDYVDLGVLAASAVALWTADRFVGRRREIDRLDGALYLLIWVAYMVYLIIER